MYKYILYGIQLALTLMNQFTAEFVKKNINYLTELQ